MSCLSVAWDRHVTKTNGENELRINSFEHNTKLDHEYKRNVYIIYVYIDRIRRETRTLIANNKIRQIRTNTRDAFEIYIDTCIADT